MKIHLFVAAANWIIAIFFLFLAVIGANNIRNNVAFILSDETLKVTGLVTDVRRSTDYEGNEICRHKIMHQDEIGQQRSFQDDFSCSIKLGQAVEFYYQYVDLPADKVEMIQRGKAFKPGDVLIDSDGSFIRVKLARSWGIWILPSIGVIISLIMVGSAFYSRILMRKMLAPKAGAQPTQE